MWLDGAFYYGGSAKTVHYRNITHNPHIAVHIGDGREAIMVEGTVEIEEPSEEMAERLSDEMFAKYPQYGRLDPSMYLGGVSVLRPRRVLAWTVSPRTPRASGWSSKHGVSLGKELDDAFEQQVFSNSDAPDSVRRRGEAVAPRPCLLEMTAPPGLQRARG